MHTGSTVDIYLRSVDLRCRKLIRICALESGLIYSQLPLCLFPVWKNLEVYCLTEVCTVRALRVFFKNYFMALMVLHPGSTLLRTTYLLYYLWYCLGRVLYITKKAAHANNIQIAPSNVTSHTSTTPLHTRYFSSLPPPPSHSPPIKPQGH